MNLDEFYHQIEELGLRFATLLHRTDSEPLSQQQRLQEAFERLKISLEEVWIAEENLRQQNSMLCQQNSELATAREVVEAESQRYQELFEFAPDGYFVTDAEATIREANSAAARLLNVSQKYLVGKPLDIFFIESERQAFADKITQLRQVNRVQEWEVRLQPRAREETPAPFDAALTVAPIHYQEGKPVTLRICVRDITERKQAEKALQLLNANLERQVQERTAQLQQALDFEAMLKRITDKVRDSLDESQILQTAVQELTLVLGVICCDTALYNLVDGSSTIRYEYTAFSNEGLSRWSSATPSSVGCVVQMADFLEVYQQLLQGQYFQFCEITAGAVRSQVAILACPIVDDQCVIGDLWLFNHKEDAFDELEIRLVQQVANQCAIAIRQARLYQAATAQVEELEKINSLKDDFLSTISHELRTPISNMRVAIRMLQSAPTAERQERYLQILQAECNREAELINNLLDLQLLEAESYFISFETVNLQDWLPSIIEPFELQTQERQQRLRVDLPSGLLPLKSDRPSLGRVLAELLNNAYKYTASGGEIVLSVRQDPETSAGVGNPNAASSLDETPVTIFIIANQAEIPAEELPHIFEKLYRVPNADPWKQGGTGLGLALVKKLVEQLQGSIQVESFKGWTTFTVKLGPVLGKLSPGACVV